MASVVLVDAGPLIALFRENDQHHAWARELFEARPGPLVTCDAVLTEALHLLKPGSEKPIGLMEVVERGIVRSSFALSEHAQRVRWLMARYATVPMSFADACLVRMTELHADVVVWTIDSDFTVYRRHGRERIPTLMPR